jgi:hypothetical protein
MNNQQVFDNALFGIRNQGYKQSVTPDGDSCAYRGKGDLKCGVGHSIPDELYKPAMECKTSGNLLSEHPEIQDLFRHVDRQLLSQIQWAHDKYLEQGFENCRYEAEMKCIADNYTLTYIEPSKELK